MSEKPTGKSSWKQGALLCALLLGLMWAGSLQLYDRHKEAQASAWRAALLAGETPYAWPLESPWEIDTGNGLETFAWRDGVLSGDSADPYLWLNLQGRVIDARRYTRLRLRLFSPQDDTLQLFHHQADEAVIHATGPLPVRPGWQVLEFDLPSLRWQARPLHGDTVTPSSWGSAAGLVSALRIDPVRDGAFAIDWIELDDPLRRRPESAAILPFHGLGDPLFDRLADDPGRIVFLADARRLRTPAISQRSRGAIAERLPSAVVFPRLPPAKGVPAPGGSPVTAPAIVYGLALLAGFLAARRKGMAGALVPPAALVAGLVATAFIEPFVPPLHTALLAAPLLLLAWLCRPARPTGAFPGDPRAWLPLAPLLLAAVVVIAWLPRIGPADSPLGETLAIYLGWALIQQSIVVLLVFERLRGPLGAYAIVLAAAAFAVLHLPNFALMAATFALELFLLGIYSRRPNLPALAAAHALAAVAINSAAPYLFWLSREVGPRFLQSL